MYKRNAAQSASQDKTHTTLPTNTHTHTPYYNTDNSNDDGWALTIQVRKHHPRDPSTSRALQLTATWGAATEICLTQVERSSYQQSSPRHPGQRKTPGRHPLQADQARFPMWRAPHAEKLWS